LQRSCCSRVTGEAFLLPPRRPLDAVARLTFFHSAARGLHTPAARREASRKARRGSAGPANGRASAAVKSWAAASREEMFAVHSVRTELNEPALCATTPRGADL